MLHVWYELLQGLLQNFSMPIILNSYREQAWKYGFDAERTNVKNVRFARQTVRLKRAERSSFNSPVFRKDIFRSSHWYVLSAPVCRRVWMLEYRIGSKRRSASAGRQSGTDFAVASFVQGVEAAALMTDIPRSATDSPELVDFTGTLAKHRQSWLWGLVQSGAGTVRMVPVSSTDAPSHSVLHSVGWSFVLQRRTSWTTWTRRTQGHLKVLEWSEVR